MKATSAVIACLLLFSCWVPSASPDIPKALLLFGGEDPEDFLGCLNCVDSSPASACKDLGKYGSTFNSNSIWNSFAKYGSSFSEYSPWNSFTDKAPIIVDRDGKSYGYFSVNAFHHDRTRTKWLVAEVRRIRHGHLKASRLDNFAPRFHHVRLIDEICLELQYLGAVSD